MPTPNINGAGVKQVSDQNTDGATIGQTASDKVGFHGAKTVQYDGDVDPSGFDAPGGGTNVDTNTSWNGNLGTNAGYYTVGHIVRALKEKGILDINGGITPA